MTGHAFLFPGQGSQSVGMLADAARAFGCVRETFEEASDALAYDLWALVTAGPDEQLTLTEYTQPAILTASVALYRCWKESGGTAPEFVAGHSLGEYSAVVVSGGFDFSTGLELVKLRAESMQNAGKINPGTMAAIIGLSSYDVNNLCNEYSKLFGKTWSKN